MNILDRIQGIIDYDTCDMQIDERDALRADLAVIYKSVQQQAERINYLEGVIHRAEECQYSSLKCLVRDEQAEEIAELKKKYNEAKISLDYAEADKREQAEEIHEKANTINDLICSNTRLATENEQQAEKIAKLQEKITITADENFSVGYESGKTEQAKEIVKLQERAKLYLDAKWKYYHLCEKLEAENQRLKEESETDYKLIEQPQNLLLKMFTPFQ